MRVGANVRQYHRIKKMHAEGMSPVFIANIIQMTPQSLEKILAHLDGRDEKILAVEENAEVQALRLANAELAARLAKFEEPQAGEAKVTVDDDNLPLEAGAEKEPDDGAQGETETVEAQETVKVDEKVEDSEKVSTEEVT